MVSPSHWARGIRENKTVRSSLLFVYILGLDNTAIIKVDYDTTNPKAVRSINL